MSKESISNSLIDAVCAGNLERVKDLISSFGLSYSPEWLGGFNLLCNAIKYKHTAVAKLLLTNGSEVNNKNIKPTDTPLHFAVINGNVEMVEMILDRGANIDVQNECGSTPFHNAVENKNMVIIELLLNRGADIDARDNNGRTPLHFAISKRYIRIINLLLQQGAKVNSVCTVIGKEGFTPLHLAAENGSEEIIKLLLSSNAYINADAKNNLTPLYIAVKNGYKKNVILLLKHGANVDTQDKDGKTIIHLAVEKGYLVILKHILKYFPNINNHTNRISVYATVHGDRKNHNKVVESLLQYGFTVHLEDVNNSELLHAAVQNGHLEIVEDLLRYGADVNTLTNKKYKKGYTLLHTATENKQEEIITLLINYGADLNAKDETTGKTPIFCAVENYDLKITNLLITNKANINAKQNDGKTALYIASECGYYEIVEALLKCGAKIDSKKDVSSPLHAAVQEGHEQIVEILLKFGAEIDSINENGDTALHIASKEGHTKIVVGLVECGFDINITNKNNCTPLDHAVDVIDLYLHYEDYDYYYGDYSIYQEQILEFLEKRIIMMTTANLYIHTNNIVHISNDNAMLYFQDECEEELNDMKSEKIGNTNVSFYDILTKHLDQLVIYMRNETIVEILKSNDFASKYMLYASMIYNQFWKGMERKELLDQVIIFYHSLFDGFPELPYNCVEKIFSYLSDKELRILLNVRKRANISSDWTINDAYDYYYY